MGWAARANPLAQQARNGEIAPKERPPRRVGTNERWWNSVWAEIIAARKALKDKAA